MNNSVVDHRRRHCGDTFEALRQTESIVRCLVLLVDRWKNSQNTWTFTCSLSSDLPPGRVSVTKKTTWTTDVSESTGVCYWLDDTARDTLSAMSLISHSHWCRARATAEFKLVRRPVISVQSVTARSRFIEDAKCAVF